MTQGLRTGGRQFRVIGASSKTGEDVEIMVEAYDEADAARAANRQGVYVSKCVPADGSSWASGRAAAPAAPAAATAAAPALTFADMVGRDPVVQKLVKAHPDLGPRVKRLNADDRYFLSDLVAEPLGISYRDSAHVARLMADGGKQGAEY